MNSHVDMDDWHTPHANAAAAQGWCLSEVGLKNTAHCVEIQRIDDAKTTSMSWGMQIPQLDSDDHAVNVMHEAWLRGEPHAVLAYQILKMCSPSEFDFWRMNSWHKSE
jgi:hypothetical protein